MLLKETPPRLFEVCHIPLSVAATVGLMKLTTNDGMVNKETRSFHLLM